MHFAQIVFGPAKFPESEEYLEFQFKFLIVLLVSGAAFTALFLFGAALDLNRMDNPHLHSMTAFTLASLCLWLLLRGHKARFTAIAWSYETLCLLEYTSALIFVPEDELRVLWFFSNVPGVYILLGQRAGFIITALSISGLALINSHLSRPYSPNAMATCLIGMAYLALFFHLYGNRSISYFVRMRQSNEQLREMATHDMLTGILNARAYYALCDRLIAMAGRDGTPYAVLFVDLDHFKSINDTHGHAAGDIVLKAVADCLGRNLRHSDALGRIGGEEFSIFLPNTPLANACQVAETIRLAIEHLLPPLAHGPVPITASIGVAASRRGTVTMHDIQRQADQAMYLAKARGRNRVSTFDETITPAPLAAPVA